MSKLLYIHSPGGNTVMRKSRRHYRTNKTFFFVAARN